MAMENEPFGSLYPAIFVTTVFNTFHQVCVSEVLILLNTFCLPKFYAILKRFDFGR